MVVAPDGSFISHRVTSSSGGGGGGGGGSPPSSALSTTVHIVALFDDAELSAVMPPTVPALTPWPESAVTDVMRPLPPPIDCARSTTVLGGVQPVASFVLLAQ